MSNEPKHPIPPADATRLAGEAYRTQIVPNRTRLAGAGYQSILATQLAAQPAAGPTERYKIGDRIGGRYEVLAIHRGSMGVVYGTFDHQEQLPRALKTLQERFAAKPRMRDLFAEEAATWVRLEKHPFIVRAYLVEMHDGLPYVITEYVRGEEGMGGDLQAWLGHPRLTLKLAVEMALQIAQGMQHAGRKIPGLVHRDLKPANILVDSRARAMVTDFGLVGAAEAEAGTPAYMAPEQWRGESLDPRTDIYAFGCILYEMFTGHRMFAAETVEEWKSAHLTRMPAAPRNLRPDLPEEMEAVVMKCLAKAPAERPLNWDDVVTELAELFHHLTGQPAVLDFSAFELTASELCGASYSLAQLEKYAEMLLACDRALKLTPNDFSILINRAVALLELNRLKEAIDCCDSALANDPTNAIAWNNKGLILYRLKRDDEAIVCYGRALELDPNFTFAWQNEGIVFDKRGRYHEAIACFDRALAINPNYAEAWNRKGDSLINLKNYKEAIECYSSSIALEPNKVAAWNNKGVALMNLNRCDEAIVCFNHALEMFPTNVEAWENKGRVLYELERYDDAIACFDRALELKPDYPNAWIHKGRALDHYKRHDEANVCFDRALQINPEDASAYFYKGVHLVTLERLDEAIGCFDRSLEIAPKFAAPYFYKGVALHFLKHYDKAIKCYDCALEIDPSLKQAAKNRNSILQQIR